MTTLLLNASLSTSGYTLTIKIKKSYRKSSELQERQGKSKGTTGSRIWGYCVTSRTPVLRLLQYYACIKLKTTKNFFINCNCWLEQINPLSHIANVTLRQNLHLLDAYNLTNYNLTSSYVCWKYSGFLKVS